MDNQPSPAQIEALEKENVQKIKQLVLQNLQDDDFYRTRRGICATMISIPLTYGYFQWFKPGHPVKWPCILGVCVGGVLHSWVSLSRDIYSICESDTVLGDKFRTAYQNISEHNIFVPYFKDATLRSYQARTGRLNSENKSSNI